MVDWETIREIALSYPEAKEVPGERPQFRVRGKLFAWMSRPRDGGTLAVRVDRDEKQLLLDGRSEIYFETPHYNGYPAVLVRLDRIDRDELAEMLEDSWLIQAPKRLSAAFLERR